jgi:hypothetical protein
MFLGGPFRLGLLFDRRFGPASIGGEAGEVAQKSTLPGDQGGFGHDGLACPSWG